MTTRVAKAYGESAVRVADELQAILVGLIALDLQGKQVQWSARGPSLGR
jgi:hypothetical protein